MGAGFNFIDRSLRVLTPFPLILLFWFTFVLGRAIDKIEERVTELEELIGEMKQ